MMPFLAFSLFHFWFASVQSHNQWYAISIWASKAKWFFDEFQSIVFWLHYMVCVIYHIISIYPPVSLAQPKNIHHHNHISTQNIIKFSDFEFYADMPKKQMPTIKRVYTRIHANKQKKMKCFILFEKQRETENSGE